MSDRPLAPPARADIEYAPSAGETDEVSQPLPLSRRALALPWVHKLLILIVLVGAWEAYARFANNPLLVPTFTQTVVALRDAAVGGPLFQRVAVSLRILLTGYAIGLALAAALTMLAVSFRIGSDLLSLLTAMFNPLPAIALLPLALLWFGLGYGSLVFVIVHSVLWPVALNTLSGFRAVSETLRMVGQNYGLRGVPYIVRILVPAAFPSILTGLKIGWAFA
ncbi:MAG TPA: ABC transporter permease subunit [Stellaceae bacterium]|nr:ABC transporter permease subunit [Stellaceae bacterium]